MIRCSRRNSVIGWKFRIRFVALALFFTANVCAHDARQLIASGDGVHTCSRELSLSRGVSLPDDIANTHCYKHSTCEKCLQDPCSRASRTQIKGQSSSVCVWCSQLQRVDTPIKEACLPSNLVGNYCKTNNISWDKPGDVCSKLENQEQVEENGGNEDRCVLFGDGYALKLDGSSYEHQQPGYPTVVISFGLCKPPDKSTYVGRKCGSKAVMEATQTVDSLYVNHISDVKVLCWYGNDMKEFSASLKNFSTPSEGVTLNYGLSDCCPTGHESSGVVSSLRVRLTLTTAWDHCDNPHYMQIAKGMPGLHIALSKCSANTVDDIEFNIVTSQLCPKFIDWQLDVNFSTLSCIEGHKYSLSVVTCSISPVFLRRDQNLNDYSFTYSHVILVFTNTSGKTWNKTLADLNDHPNGSSSFVVRSHGLHKIEGLYRYYNLTAVPLAGNNPFVLKQSDSILVQSYYLIVIIPPVILLASAFAFASFLRNRCCHPSYRRLSNQATSDANANEVEPAYPINPNRQQTGPTPSTVVPADSTLEGATGVSSSTPFATATDTGHLQSVIVADTDTDRNNEIQTQIPASQEQLDCEINKTVSVFIVVRQRDMAWCEENLEPLLKKVPNLRILNVADNHGKQVDAISSTVNSSTYVIFVVSDQTDGDNNSGEESGSYDYMVARAEKRLLEKNKQEKMFVISRDGKEDCIPRNLDHLTYTDGSSVESMEKLISELKTE